MDHGFGRDMSDKKAVLFSRSLYIMALPQEILIRFWNNVQRWVAAAECAATACCTMLALPPESQSSDYVVVPEKEKIRPLKWFLGRL